MGNSSTKLAEKCSLLAKDEIPVVASSFKLVSKNSERIKEDDLMVNLGTPRLKTATINASLASIEILGIPDGPAAGAVHNELSVWPAGQ